MNHVTSEAMLQSDEPIKKGREKRKFAAPDRKGIKVDPDLQYLLEGLSWRTQRPIYDLANEALRRLLKEYSRNTAKETTPSEHILQSTREEQRYLAVVLRLMRGESEVWKFLRYAIDAWDVDNPTV